jgi:hypothetical protein
MRCFVIQGFGEKFDSKGQKIDFEAVDRALIAPALRGLSAPGQHIMVKVESTDDKTKSSSSHSPDPAVADAITGHRAVSEGGAARTAKSNDWAKRGTQRLASPLGLAGFLA